jgi:hypothetical protein
MGSVWLVMYGGEVADGLGYMFKASLCWHEEAHGQMLTRSLGRKSGKGPPIIVYSMLQSGARNRTNGGPGSTLSYNN